MKRAGIKDVAKLAGVSITTVSRALNGYNDVSEETREKIKKVAEELNYAPNINARSLGGKAETTIALLISGFRDKDESGVIYGILSGAYHSAIKNKCEFILLTTNQSKQKEVNFIQLCRQRNVDGVIVQGVRIDDPYYKELTKTEIPCVAIDLNISGEMLNSISIDNVEASYIAVSNLLSKGHKNIAIINGTDTADVSKERFTGYAKALIEDNISLNFEYIKNGVFTEEGAYHKTIELLNSNPEITAIFCCSDVMAIGTIDAIKDMGKSVPEDISVVGFDDMPVSKYINGGLSTIKQDPFETGQIAADLIHSMINKEDDNEKIVLPFEYIERNTVREIK